MMELPKIDNEVEIRIIEGKHIISFSISNKINEEILCDIVGHLLELMQLKKKLASILQLRHESGKVH